MNPLPYIFPYAPIFWTIMVWAFWPEFKIIQRAQKSIRSADSLDAGSCNLIVIGMWIALLAAFPVGWVPEFRFSEKWDIAVFIVGLITLIGGSLLRRHCWRVLGESFTGDVQARAGQHIVTSGAYHILRHPSYTAGILMYTGIGLALGSWASTALLVVTSFVIYVYRMTVEERALLEAIGEPYREFMRTRNRLIPYVY
jgi:protein-S-isoprenylcysteine O-methyltransferase Ste14